MLEEGIMDKPQPIDAELLSCAACCAEVPVSAALSAEGTEYVLHFCGPECYAKFCVRAGTSIFPGDDDDRET